MLTSRALARAAFPFLPGQVPSERLALNRTYGEVRPWDGFLEEANRFVDGMDDELARFAPVCNAAESPASDKIHLLFAQHYLFKIVNGLLASMSIPFRYELGTVDRSLSQADFSLLIPPGPVRKSSKQERPAVSPRVYAVGMATKEEDATANVQNVYGAMVLDEVQYGFVTSYNNTWFFRRSSCPTEKVLEISPMIDLEKPLQYYAFVAAGAFKNTGSKRKLRRELVPLETSLKKRKRGRLVPTQLEKTSLRKRKWGSGDLSFEEFSVANMVDLGLTQRVARIGKYGCLLEGRIGKCPAVLKTYDLRIASAEKALYREVMAYDAMVEIQGTIVPRVLGIGRLPHCSYFAFIALSDEGCMTVENMKHIRGEDKLQILQALKEIHACKVLHGDINLHHIMKLPNGVFKFLDFGNSRRRVAKLDYNVECHELDQILRER